MIRAQTIGPEEDVVDPQTWIVKVLRMRFDNIVELYSAPLEHPRDEGVHDMRVSVRRLRSALRDYAHLTDKFPLKKIRKDLKVLGDVLGGVRDLDVAIGAFKEAAKRADDTDIEEGIHDIVKDCKSRRHEAYDRLEKHLSKHDLAELTKGFDRAIDHSLRQHELFASNVYETARAVVENRLDEFLRNIDAIYDPFAVRKIHRLRIAGKNLRYSLELFGELWNGELTQFTEEIKKMQSYLGDLHDRDFWIAGSSKRISAERPQSRREQMIYQARIWLLSEFTRQRMEAYREALQTWSDWRGADFPGQLRKIIANGN
jgi:CHAD domain-containing protein